MEKQNKKNPFKTPKGYFEKFESKLSEKLSDAPLSIIPKNEGFKIPDGYFDSLNKNIQQKLEAGESKVISLKSYKKYYYVAASVAAVIMVVLGLTWNTEEKASFENLAHAEIETYFEENGLGFSSYEIAELIPVDELEISDILSNNFSEDNVLEYLNENTDSFEELNLEYNE